MEKGTWHILEQVKWYKKLRTHFRCVEVELEKYVVFREGTVQWLIVDVWGKTKEGKIFIVEVGDIKDRQKSTFLERLGKEKRIVFIHVQF